ncbi:MAG: M28 family peptidase [Gemmatimonadetes bacterium]|nr:M28 family peptidase [Gemmatimonadota bacterium]MDA1102023.1 M28 family peptidase [Gemmatimonadota bacterium]
MSDYKLPDLPSDEELGITNEDREKYEEDAGGDRPELSDAEMAALLGESAGAKKDATKPKAKAPEGKAADKAASKDAKLKAREAKKQAQTDKKQARSEEARAALTVRSRWRGPVTFAVILGVCAVASTRSGMPRPVPANAPDTAFSSSRAMSTLIEIARRPHPTGSPEHARVRTFLVDRLRALGLDPEVQTTTTVVQSSPVVRAATVRNIVARIPGSASTGALLITAHYDSRELSSGAADDGFGVVAIIEAVRAIQAGESLRNDVIVLITDAEELGLLGAKAFVDEHPWMSDVSLALSVEMRGGGGPSIMFETGPDNGWVVGAMKDFDSHPFANSLSLEIYKRLPNGTDFTRFKDAGVQGLNFAAIDRAHVYHQALDRPENVSEATLQHHGFHTLGALKYFGNADLTVVNGPDLVYFSVPLFGLFTYDVAWVLPISGLLVVLFGLCLLLGYRVGVRPGAAVAGLVVAVLSGALAYGLAYGLAVFLPRFHEEAGSLAGSEFHGEGWYMLALGFASLFVVSSLSTLARRWLALLELLLGAAIVPLALAIWLGFATPLGAMNLQWPVMAFLLATIAVGLLAARSEGGVGWVAAVALAIPVLVMLEPVIELIWIAMTFRLVGVLAVLMVMGLYLCLPAVAALRHPNGWWAPVTSLALGGGALGIGILTAGPADDRPSPSTLVYAYEHGSGAAVWATSPSTEGSDVEAQAWAVQRAGAAFGSTRDLSGFGYRSGETPVAPATVVTAQPPSAVVVFDTIAGPERRVSMRIRSNIGAEFLRVQYDAGGNTRLLSLNGVPIENPGSMRWADHWGEPEEDLMLELTMPATEPIGIQIVEHLLRPGELLGDGSFQRPAGLSPDVSWMSDRAMFLYSVAAFADPRHGFIPPTGGADLQDVPASAGLAPTGTPVTGVPIDSLVIRTDTLIVIPDSTASRDTLGMLDTMRADTSGTVSNRAPR